MEGHQQAGPPTPGHQEKANHSPSPVANSPFQNDLFNTPLESVASTQNHRLLDSSSEYLPPVNSESQPPSFNQHTFLQSQKGSSPHFAPQKDVFSSDILDMNGSAGNGSSFEAQFFPTTSEAQNVPLDSTLLLDPLLEQQTIAGQSVNPATLLNQMSATQSQASSSPYMLQSDMLNSSPLTNISPSGEAPFNQGSFTSPNGSRHTSLDPSASAFPPGSNTGWAREAAFQHRRTPSDTYSDVSSSAVPSPFLGNLDNFDAVDHTSPLLAAQQDQTLFPEMVQFNQFSLSEASPSQVSPAHSPHVSPQLDPAQQPLPLFMASNNFGLGPTFGDTLTGSPDENPPVRGVHGASLDYIGQADQTVTPQISIQFAPPSRQPSFEPERVDAALSPPPSGRGRPPSRNRARSDPFVCGRIPGSSRSSSTHPVPSTRPSLISQISDPTSLSPHDIVVRTSSRSPTRGRQSRSSSTSSIPRDYIIGLADPTHQNSTSGSPSEGNSGTRRTQKHPANFSCHLCTKRFTRAYNLRSHLRTHTDERPFVCNVCGKAFARQHDRKRHEGLHSGEKKFVCRGTLKDGGAWGCSRRFARADALGRHFRSEAGRICIKPLLEEESVERSNKAWDGAGTSPQQVGNANGAGSMSITGQNEAYFAGNPAMSASMPALSSQAPGLSLYPSISTPPGAMRGAGIGQIGPSASSILAPNAAAAAVSSSSSSGYTLPAALLAQYPALAGIQWDALPPGQPDEIEGDVSGRSSFDASSGGEWFEDEDESFVGGQQQKGQNGAQAQQQHMQTQVQLEQQQREQQQKQQDEDAVQQLLYGA